MINIVTADSSQTRQKLQASLDKIPPQKDNPNWTLVLNVMTMTDWAEEQVFEVQIDCGEFEPQIEGVDFT